MSLATRCPECDARWANNDGSSKLIGIYDHNQDRTVEWLCPFCGKRWARNDPALTQTEPDQGCPNG